jgi:hypothetical protein
MGAMPTRLLFTMLLTAVACSATRAQNLFKPGPSPSAIVRAEALDEPPERIKPLPRVLDEELPDPILNDALAESYQGIDPVIPNRFGSAPNQRTWGYAGGRFIFNGEKTAPNGALYHPYFSLDLNFNFALTRDRRFYGYFDTRFWAQSNQDKVAQSSIDFSKRQFDLHPGLAWNFYGRMEARVFAYSFNNLNRGNSLTQPFGFNDGVAVEGRYYFAGTDFDTGIYNFLSVGYYLSKEMIGNDGNLWQPGGYLRWTYNIPLWQQRIYLFTIGEFITEKPFDAKWVWLDTGLSCRPIKRYPMFDLRVGNESNIDIINSKTRMMWYVGGRFAF